MTRTSDGGEEGRRSGSEKLAGLMSMIKHDRAEKHVQSGLKAAEGKDWDLAVEELVRALFLFEEMHEAARVASVRNSLSLCYFALGRLDEAESEARKAASQMKKLPDPEGEATALLGLANVLLAKGDLKGSEKTFERAHSLFRTLDLWDGVMRSYLGLERVALKKGDAQAAESARDQAERARRQLVNGC